SFYTGEVIEIITRLGRRPYFLAKIELFRYALTGWPLSKMGGIPVNRGRADSAALRTAIALLKRGEILALFPEGTRKRENRLECFLPGVGFLSLKASVPVVPAYIAEFGSFPGLRRRVAIRFGPPVLPVGTPDEMTKKILEAVRALAELK
ncbi:MAG: lysophospholipid acyltransferase family protein, partial [Elusimicrobiota bacterium]